MILCLNLDPEIFEYEYKMLVDQEDMTMSKKHEAYRCEFILKYEEYKRQHGDFPEINGDEK